MPRKSLIFIIAAGIVTALLVSGASAAPGNLGASQSGAGLVVLAHHGGHMGMHMRSGPRIADPLYFAHSRSFRIAHHRHHRRFFFVGVPYYDYYYDNSNCWWSRRHHHWVCRSYY